MIRTVLIVDDDREIKRKKLAFKEQVAEAKAYLDGQKSKYYDEIKAGSRLTSEQQKAWDFFNRYNKESEETRKIADKAKLTFQRKTDKVFNDKFKGFEYNVGDKKYRFNVKNAEGEITPFNFGEWLKAVYNGTVAYIKAIADPRIGRFDAFNKRRCYFCI